MVRTTLAQMMCGASGGSYPRSTTVTIAADEHHSVFCHLLALASSALLRRTSPMEMVAPYRVLLDNVRASVSASRQSLAAPSPGTTLFPPLRPLGAGLRAVRPAARPLASWVLAVDPFLSLPCLALPGLTHPGCPGGSSDICKSDGKNVEQSHPGPDFL